MGLVPVQGCPLYAGCSAAGAALVAILEGPPTSTHPFKRGQEVLQYLLLTQAKPAFEDNDGACFILWTAKVESVQ